MSREAARLLLFRAGHPHDTERVLIAVDVAVQVQRQLLGVPFVGLDFLAVLIPVTRAHDIINGAHLFQLPMQVVAKRTGLVAREHFLGQADLLGHPEQELRRPESLRRLGRTAVEDPHDHVAIQMNIYSEFDVLGLNGVFSFRCGLPAGLCLGL